MNLNRGIVLITIAIWSALNWAVAQQTAPTIKRTAKVRQSAKTETTADTLSQRAKLLYETLIQGTERASWIRTIYRQLDLSKEANAPLYYPTHTTESSQNLFAQIFKLVAENQINVYEYLDGEEVFTPEYKVKFKELLDRFRINYTETKEKTQTKYRVTNADIPTSEVKSYYIKETWFFDEATSTYDVKLDALCPILYDLGDYGEVPMPLFWLPYEELKPFISITPVMLSSRNNKASSTLDDYFRLRMYDGEIIKTKNLLNKALTQYITTPDSLSSERKRIEDELETFKANLFVKREANDTDSLTGVPQTPRQDKNANTRDKRVRSKNTAKAVQPKVSKSKAPKATSKPSTGGRSVRGRI